MSHRAITRECFPRTAQVLSGVVTAIPPNNRAYESDLILDVGDAVTMLIGLGVIGDPTQPQLEGPCVLFPTYLHDALRHEREVLPHLPCNAYALYDRATMICMIVAALRRYAADHADVLASPLQVRVRTALHEAEREMHWLALCGGDADEIDLLAAVTSALARAERAAALLRTDVSGVFMAVTENSTA